MCGHKGCLLYVRVERVSGVDLNFPLLASLGPGSLWASYWSVHLETTSLRYIHKPNMEQESNIRQFFVAARNQRKQLETSTDPTSALYQENLQSAIAALEGCKKIADRISLFSQNEIEEDIASGDLQ